MSKAQHLLLIDGYGDYLSVEGERLVLKRKEEEQHFAISELEAVLITKVGASVSTSALMALNEAGVGLSLLSRAQTDSLNLSPRAPRQIALRRVQYTWRRGGVGASLAWRCVLDKLRVQTRFVESVCSSARFQALSLRDRQGLKRSQKTLRELTKSLASQTPPQEAYEASLFPLEARAARLWWGCVKRLLPGELEFKGRALRGEGGGPFNAALNYGYAILAARLTHLLSALGFEVGVGCLHADSDGRPSLTYDLIERYRQRYVDAPLIKYVRSGGVLELTEDGLLTRSARGAVSEVIVEALNPRRREGLTLIRGDLEGLRRSLLRGEAWSPELIPKRLLCLL